MTTHDERQCVVDALTDLRETAPAATERLGDGSLDVELENGTDGYGEPTVLVSVFVPETTPPAALTWDRLGPIQTAAFDAVYSSREDRWPLIRFRKRSETVAARPAARRG